MEVRYTHYRIPESIYRGLEVNGTRAKPNQGILFYYSPDYGFGGEYAGDKPAVRGGMTICTVEGEDSAGRKLIGRGAAFCSLHDNFCYRIGREIAEGRARSNVAAHATNYTLYTR